VENNNPVFGVLSLLLVYSYQDSLVQNCLGSGIYIYIYYFTSFNQFVNLLFFVVLTSRTAESLYFGLFFRNSFLFSALANDLQI